MSFPDQSHMNRVRNALWERSGNGASIMVGSGFSLNAIPIRPNASNLPTWSDVTEQLHMQLYPEDESAGRLDELDTAQEYEAAFGRGRLHDALQQLVRDIEYNPSQFHRRLMRLPWQDVYTTNWDTLLERTRSLALEQHYSVINSVDQIPMAKRPRIVKLHGSLPAQFPLIVTEEDYRTYPIRFAPFVNTVQQAMMETVFCLIGFSGNDPNFLNWSGWVRDNLGASAPKIYLAGWLNLSPHRRRMLENRNVVPIDLAQHPQAHNWPESLQHQLATEWLLETLERGRPYDITNWPSPPNQEREEIRELLRPVDTVTSTIPKVEPVLQQQEEPLTASAVRNVTHIWRHNRSIYPGWLTMPSTKRRDTNSHTEMWSYSILRSLQGLSTIERLDTLRELVWREEIRLEPTSPDLESAIEETLDLVDCGSRTIDRVNCPGADWKVIREAWRNTAATLITAARYRLDQASFEARIAALSSFEEEDIDLRHRIRHERCLWAIYDMNFDQLDYLLSDWQTENCDPVWMMRKSGVLWEAGHDVEADDLLQRAIAAIKGTPPNEASVAAQSREAWATLAALRWNNRPSLLDRLRALAPMRCDVFLDRDTALEDLGLDSPRAEPPPFDINRRSGSRVTFINYDAQRAAYRAVRLSELTGQPPFVNDGLFSATMWADVLKKAAQELAEHRQELAVRLVLRACSGDADTTLQHVLSRRFLATLPSDRVEILAHACLRTIDRRLAQRSNSGQSPRATAAIEVLSRLVLRMPPENAPEIFDKAMLYCHDPQLAQSTAWTPILHLLQRSWEALSYEDRNYQAVDLLNTPIAGLDSPLPLGQVEWPDPVEVLQNMDSIPHRTPDNESRWRTCVELITRGLRSNPTARRRASLRMMPLIYSGALTNDEYRQIAEALWGEQQDIPDGFPDNIEPFDWVVLSLPEPSPELAEQRFKQKWLTNWDQVNDDWYRSPQGGFTIAIRRDAGLNGDPHDLDSRLWQAGNALVGLRNGEQRLQLSEDEKSHLGNILEMWSDSMSPELQLLSSGGVSGYLKERTQLVTRALPNVIKAINTTSTTAEKLYAKMLDLVHRQVPAFALAPSLVTILPERLPEVATSMRLGLTSSNGEIASGAIQGLRLWLEEATKADADLDQPPDDLIQEVGLAIASPRSTVIEGALWAAQWIFENGLEAHKSAIRGLVLTGLNHLAAELRYDLVQPNEQDIPLQRLLCVKLALAMTEEGSAQDPIVAHWVKIAKEDPFPEVRNAVTSPA